MKNGLYSVHIHMLDGVKGRDSGILVLRNGVLIGGGPYFWSTGSYTVGNSGSAAPRHGSVGIWIEDKNSGTILLQQAIRRQWPATAIESKLTAMGKDERALSVSSYVYRENVKYTDYAFDKTTVHKRKSRNHLVDQIESFRIGDKDNKREDDLGYVLLWDSNRTGEQRRL